MKFITTLLFILCAHVIVAQEVAKITGSITDSDNNPIPFASAYISELKKGSAADEDGNFTIPNIPYGLWQLTTSAVGFKPATVAINLNEPVLSGIIFQLTHDNELDQVEVFGNRNDRPDKIESITRLPLKTYEQIQSISVLSEKLIEDQGALSISDATKNVPGVYTFATYGNKRESMSSRGFRGIPILKNGVRIHSDFRGVGILTDMQGVDNIQVLKGTASITQGVATDLGSPGGIINIVTKTPKYTTGGSVSLRGGSFGKIRPTFDVFGPLNKEKNIAFRLNGALERADSFRDLVEKESFYFNPSFEWKINDKTTVTLELDHYYDSRTPDLGTVNLAENDTNAIYDLPHSQFLGFENDRSITQNTTYAVRMDHELSDKLTLKGAFYSSSLKLDDKGAKLNKTIEVNEFPLYNVRQRSYSTSTRDDDNSVLQFDLIGDKIYTGSIKHTFQIGFDYRSSHFSTARQSTAVVDTINVFQNIEHRLPNISLDEANLNGGKTNSLGFVAQDVISWNSWLKTFLGARYSSTETISEVENTRSDAFNPLGGIIISPIKNVNLFVSYTNSSYPRSAARLGENGEELGNERYDQLETGFKTTWLNDRLRFNLTLYKINNKNINLPVYDETWANILYYAKGGNDQRQGIEVELTGRPLENLELIGGYAYIDAQYKEHTSYVYGSEPLNTPKHTFNAYVNYSFRNNTLEGLSLGAGAYFTGERPINDWSSGAITHQGIVPGQKPFNVDAYTLVNFQAEYQFNQNWSFQFLLNNVFDKIGYNAYRTSYINQTDPRNFAGVLRYNF
ncbi:TonB-dependent siderophore receptor [Aequorivita sublithincola DSM 14238]|uniref:TonB-dependent siderophore receptor n=1 Tax=Aequorivita sublithincola (strain DSM 14238 / LMG 21431 / ACAM 643 / 9-3) TaxID=746697 RepID=I3YW39_AEQSU|nr:TonB-dependent receptor [Aequorivita sublithincola]AFL81207.1 TonB-dependent siderophore receptor [Aequorivita sublithincola DSM 14238]